MDDFLFGVILGLIIGAIGIFFILFINKPLMNQSDFPCAEDEVLAYSISRADGLACYHIDIVPYLWDKRPLPPPSTPPLRS